MVAAAGAFSRQLAAAAGYRQRPAQRLVTMLQDARLQSLIHFLQQQNIPAQPSVLGVGVVENRQTEAEAQRQQAGEEAEQ